MNCKFKTILILNKNCPKADHLMFGIQMLPINFSRLIQFTFVCNDKKEGFLFSSFFNVSPLGPCLLKMSNHSIFNVHMTDVKKSGGGGSREYTTSTSRRKKIERIFKKISTVQCCTLKMIFSFFLLITPHSM